MCEFNVCVTTLTAQTECDKLFTINELSRNRNDVCYFIRRKSCAAKQTSLHIFAVLNNEMCLAKNKIHIDIDRHHM